MYKLCCCSLAGTESYKNCNSVASNSTEYYMGKNFYIPIEPVKDDILKYHIEKYLKPYKKEEAKNMSEIKVIGACDSCLKKAVCQFVGEREEILTKMNGRLDNTCCPDIFTFKTECTEFLNKVFYMREEK